MPVKRGADNEEALYFQIQQYKILFCDTFPSLDSAGKSWHEIGQNQS